jgi:YQGE family putative transporter
MELCAIGGTNMPDLARTSLINWRRFKREQVPAEKKLSRDAVISLIIHSMFQFGASMSGVFLNLYLWRLTHSLAINGTYNIILYITVPIAFAVGGWLTKKKDRMVACRFGIGLTSIFYLIVILVQGTLVEYYVWFAIFQGIAQAFYWVGYLTLMYDVSNEQNRIRYLALNMIFFTAATLAGPALAGFIIKLQEGLQGYTIVFGIAFLMFFLATLVSFKIKKAGGRHKPYYLKFAGILMKKNSVWRKSLLGFFVLGLLQGIMLFLPNILLFQVMPREDIVGYLGAIYSSLSILTGLFISRYARSDRVRLYLLISSIGLVIGVTFLLGSLTLFTVISFMVLYSIFAPLQGNSMTSNYYSLIAKLPLRGELKVEGVVIREMFINPGRVISILVLVVFSGDFNGSSIPWILFGATLTQFFIIWLVNKE